MHDDARDNLKAVLREGLMNSWNNPPLLSMEAESLAYTCLSHKRPQLPLLRAEKMRLHAHRASTSCTSRQREELFFESGPKGRHRPLQTCIRSK